MRIRLVFEEENLLMKKLSGLRRCWFLIKPEISTVADLDTELCRRFQLHRRCPDGVVFKMDDFVIPPRESTSFFREKDIVSVYKRECKKKKMITSGDDMQPSGKGETVEKETVPCGNEMLAIESRERIESRNNQVIRERNSFQQTQLAEMGSKRKHREIEKPKSSKKKKKPKLTTIEEEVPHQESLQSPITPEQILHEKANLSVVNELSPMEVVATDNAGVSNEISQMVPERNNHLKGNCNTITSEPDSGVLTKKKVSRSTRRKHNQREFRKRARKQAAENMQCEALLNCTEEPAQANHVVPAHEPTVTNDLVVPRVDRPGHIRFESEGEEDENHDEGPSNMQPNEPPVESFHWNGITNKTKGQKWGQEKNKYSASRCNSTINWRDGTDEDSFANEKVTEKSTSGIGMDITVQVNFESLSPLTRTPKVGELIAYRVVELSSSWCPDLSPFRVGEVKVHDLMSNKIILAPVPEYPISSAGKEDEANEGDEDAPCREDLSLYKEDGSLEIEFSSLVDVRLLRACDLASSSASSVNRETNSSQAAMKRDKYLANGSEMAVAKSTADVQNLFLNNSRNVAIQTGGEELMVVPTGTDPSANWMANGEAENAVINRYKESQSVEKNMFSNNNWDVAVQNDPKESVHDPTGTKPNSNWEANDDAANAGNAETQQNGWENWPPNTSTPSWSYRALRSTALGPILARLRGNDVNATSGYGSAARGDGGDRGSGGGWSRGGGKDGGRSRGGQRRGRGNYGMSSG